MSSLQGNWNFPTPVRFGAGRIAELPDACRRTAFRGACALISPFVLLRELGMTKPLIVTDPGLASLPMIQASFFYARTDG